jgi:phosphoribosyl 1,2-cyclic phosphodiesterase
MRLYSLGSGSSGNGFIVENAQAAVLLDCGIAARACQSALRELGLVERLGAVVISHEHTDHIRSVAAVLRKRDCHIVTTAGTYRSLRHDAPWFPHQAGDRFTESGIEVTFVGVSHDAAEPCGFVIDADGTRVAIFTDLGYVSEEVLDAVSSADIIVLESNFDTTMLKRGGYPAHLKRRIQSPVGHLSNDDCASALVAAVNARTRGIWLAHLSHNNNTPELAVNTASDALRLAGFGIPVQALPRYERVEITRLPARQLMFGM